ncbi:MAG: SMR family transporter [Amaricoccus sp.]|uniref:DMT family transporter n=1 Tax=Amaricoccus sp. TaxID=1872485 RepID=UPI003314A0DB
MRHGPRPCLSRGGDRVRGTGDLGFAGHGRLCPAPAPLIAIGGHAFAFHFLSPTPRTMPVGPIHAIWSGAGIVPVAAVGWTLFRQTSTHRPMPVRACWRSPRAGRGSRLPTCR